MNNRLKKELAVVTGLLALASLRKKSPILTGALSLGTLSLFFSSLKKKFDFAEKNVYITGGSRGLGLSLAWNILQRGGQVTLAARDTMELFRARDILKADFPQGRIFISTCDVTDTEQLALSLYESIHQMKGIDLLINNAGTILVGPFSSMERADFESLMRLHLYAVIDATQLIIPYFKTKGDGRILNICSLGGKVAVPHMLPYDASKFALAGFSQGVRAELAPHGIQVMTAYPTVMRTGSPIQAVFKGNHEKEFEWFATFDNLPLLSMSADRAAKKILDGVEEGRSEIILSWPAKARIFLGGFFPEILNSLLSFAARFMPQEDSFHRKTGAQSSRSFEKNFILKPLAEKAKKTQDMYNQMAQVDAETSMGLKH